MAEGERILVLGIGNILWADEGFGVRAVERLRDGWDLPARVTVLDGGTQGLYLLPHLEEADALIIVDAIDYGLEPGTLRVFRDGDVPAFLGARKMSLHQTGFQEVLASARLLGRCPDRLVLVGVQPRTLDDYGGGLTPPVAAQVGPAVDLVLRLLAEEFAVAATPRAAAPETADPVSRDAYEAGRPSAEAACRVGDARVLSGACGG
ncbi:HyaD/HybD family hydrogenase maturation endopeptidase [Azospirillum halopraeferens]|uniref:HyaD/HybD family hydrogenase maturation endopeptidase n=1 Tax=Azospirillum halopraeferens TaxID=34010 RepID=UPI0004133B20|nr:HyaD/HybD family hydrogenase maturation endopeptidase [Azospirillum halopraeferens]